MTAVESSFQQALEAHQIQLEDEVVLRLQEFCHRLWDWNEKLNLTRHVDFATFVSRDLIDTLKLSELIEPNQRIIDVGSGGGVPAIPLSILRPDLEISLCECIGKKAHALAGIQSEVGLSNPVYAERIENVLGSVTCDIITGRAIGPLWKILKWVQPHWGQFHSLLLHKGPNWTEERKQARDRGLLTDLQLRKASAYTMVGRDSEAVILAIRPKVE